MKAEDGSKRPRRDVQGVLGYALIAVSIWLGWEILKAPVVQRVPPALALRLAPQSPAVLQRAAERELLAEEWQDAAFLANLSLSRAPFNASALRVRGLAAARIEETKTADDLLTLAGNWSLRDGPAHAWLVEQRLRQGNYASAFAHADTLVRRRRDLHDQVFDLFTTAASQDGRAVPPLVRLMALNPPWRWSYLRSLQDRPDGDPLLLGLVVALQKTPSPLSDLELSGIYRGWISERRYEAIRVLRTNLARPALTPVVQNADFSQDQDAHLPPFGWKLNASAGMVAQIAEDDLQRGNKALRVDHDGFESAVVAQQLLLLGPGSYTFSGRLRQENESDASFEWVTTCVEGGPPLLRLRVARGTSIASATWFSFASPLQVPEGCTAQWLSLEPRPSDRRAPIVVWFDDVSIRSAANTPSSEP